MEVDSTAQKCLAVQGKLHFHCLEAISTVVIPVQRLFAGCCLSAALISTRGSWLCLWRLSTPSRLLERSRFLADPPTPKTLPPLWHLQPQSLLKPESEGSGKDVDLISSIVPSKQPIKPALFGKHGDKGSTSLKKKKKTTVFNENPFSWKLGSETDHLNFQGLEKWLRG